MKRLLLAPLVLGLALVFSGCTARKPEHPSVPVADGLELMIFHTGDTHSYVDGILANGRPAYDSARSTGGYARIAQAVADARAAHDNILFVDAGDQFQGTLYFGICGWKVIRDMDALVPWDAVTLGNHEWDLGCGTLATHLKRNKRTFLACNLSPEKGCPLAGARYLPHIVKEVRGEKVGIIGLANDDSSITSACKRRHYRERLASVREQVELLRGQGVKHIVLISHIGLPDDRALARQVDGIDVIVGGHTHSYIGDSAKERSEGPYPVVEHSPCGDPVLVVCAKFATQYLGELTVGFTREGVPATWSGSAVELTSDKPRDPAVEKTAADYRKRLNATLNETVGILSSDGGLADGLDMCRQGECVSGLLMADAALASQRANGAQMALMGGGMIRASTPVGRVSRGDVLSVTPFGNRFVLRTFTGETILKALEHGVSQEGGKGPFLLQPAGLRYTVDASQPVGSRIVLAETVDAEGRARPLDSTASYKVVITDYLANGGDGYEMLHSTDPADAGAPKDIATYMGLFKKHSPVPAPKGGRIVWK